MRVIKDWTYLQYLLAFLYTAYFGKVLNIQGIRYVFAGAYVSEEQAAKYYDLASEDILFIKVPYDDGMLRLTPWAVLRRK